MKAHDPGESSKREPGVESSPALKFCGHRLSESHSVMLAQPLRNQHHEDEIVVRTPKSADSKSSFGTFVSKTVSRRGGCRVYRKEGLDPQLLQRNVLRRAKDSHRGEKIESRSTKSITPSAPLQSNACSTSGCTMMPRRSRQPEPPPEIVTKPSRAITIWMA